MQIPKKDAYINFHTENMGHKRPTLKYVDVNIGLVKNVFAVLCPRGNTVHTERSWQLIHIRTYF